MRQFLVCYDNWLVGVLYINEEGQYKYVVNHDVINLIPATEVIAPALCKGQDFGCLIPYFKVRLDSVFGPIRTREYGFCDDKVRLREV